jgi:hypothetical protein
LENRFLSWSPIRDTNIAQKRAAKRLLTTMFVISYLLRESSGMGKRDDGLRTESPLK